MLCAWRARRPPLRRDSLGTRGLLLNRRPYVLFSAVACLVAACAPPPAPGPFVSWRSSVRPDSACLADKAQAVADTATSGVTPPQPASIMMVPTKAAARLRGATLAIHVLVDHAGHVIADSTRIDLVSRRPDPLRDVSAAVARYEFNPAVYNGCAVAAWYTIHFSF